MYALSAATISHAIARACTSGDLPGCSCGPVPGEPPGPGNRWGGCADNLSYGLLMGAKFSDAPMKVKKTGSQANKLMRLHNSEVGRQVTTHPHPRGCAAPPPKVGESGRGTGPNRPCWHAAHHTPALPPPAGGILFWGPWTGIEDNGAEGTLSWNSALRVPAWCRTLSSAMFAKQQNQVVPLDQRCMWEEA